MQFLFEILFKRAKYFFFFVVFFIFYFTSKPTSASPQFKPLANTGFVKKADVKTNRQLLNKYKNQVSLKKEQFEMCIGLVLGDANLQTQNNGKSYRLKFEVGDKNLEYLKHIQEMLDPFILSEPNQIIRVNNSGHEVKTFQLQTISHSDFNTLARGFQLEKGKKKN